MPDTPSHSSVSVSGYTAHYTCKDGYTHIGPRVSQCTERGWNGSHVPTCLPVTCPAPPPTPHGYIHISPYTGEYLVGTVAVYKCTPGHVIWGHQRRTCTDQGWTGEVPECRKLACQDPPTVDNAIMARLDTNMVTFTCSPGFVSHNGTIFGK